MQELFIVGAPRSGTTWMQILLGAHPKISTSRETHLFDRYIVPILEIRKNELSSEDQDGLKSIFSNKEYNFFLKMVIREVMNRIAARKPGASIVLEKTPGHIRHHKVIRRFLPRAKFLYLARDPRAVAASMLAARKESWGQWAPANAQAAARQWRVAATAASRGLVQYGDDYRWVRFEDLVNAPQETLSGIWRWLDIEDRRLDLAEFSVEALNRARGTGEAWSPAFEPRKNFFREGKTDGWKSELSRDDIATVEATCGELMAAFGYALSSLSEDNAAPTDEQGMPPT